MKFIEVTNKVGVKEFININHIVKVVNFTDIVCIYVNGNFEYANEIDTFEKYDEIIKKIMDKTCIDD